MILAILDTIFSEFRWFRRLSGGHWERWYIDYPIHSLLWLQNEHGTRPGLARCNPFACEDYSVEK